MPTTTIARRPRAPAAAAALAALALLPTACGDDDPTGPPEPADDGPARLAFAAAPDDAALPIVPPVRVAVLDADGEPVTTASVRVAIALAANPAGARLSGTTEAEAVDGTATFDDLRLDRTGGGFTLAATADGLDAAVSATFDVRFRLRSIDAGWSHSCGTIADSTAYCWGADDYGQLGVGDTLLRMHARPLAVTGGLAFSAVRAADHASVCALAADGAPWCWGGNGAGKLGTGSTEGPERCGFSYCSTRPVAVAVESAFDAVDGGGNHGCGIDTGGQAYCWGSNGYGQLGDGGTDGRAEPGLVAGGHVFRQLGAGFSHTCALTSAGDAYCWGSNRNRQLGAGSTDDQALVATPVDTDLTFASIAVGSYHACALTDDGTAHCWGRNDNGQLGDGTISHRASPVPVDTDLAFDRIAAGTRHTCGIATDGATYCWGRNATGQLGIGSADGPEECNFDDCSTRPVAVAGGHAFRAVGVGRSHTCALTVEGEPWCWGYNGGGRLGDGTTADASAPVPVAPPAFASTR